MAAMDRPIHLETCHDEQGDLADLIKACRAVIEEHKAINEELKGAKRRIARLEVITHGRMEYVNTWQRWKRRE